MLRWLQKHPSFLERAYTITSTIFRKLDPAIRRVGYGRFNRFIRAGEELGKKAVFDCHMCGQCILHSTGMTCPMTCPKNLRNGPCGGVRANGHCEVKPKKKCVWVEAFERSTHMPQFGSEILQIQPPVNKMLTGKSAWVNMLTGDDKKTPPGWIATSNIEIISVIGTAESLWEKEE